MKRQGGIAAMLGAAALLLGGADAPEPALKPLLGQVVDACTPETVSTRGGAVCLALSADRRFVLLKDLRGASQFLVVGHDPALRLGHYDQPEPKMWTAAWHARTCVQAILREFDGRDVPESRIGAAINSRFGASQDRQHIHVDVLRDEVLTALAGRPATVTVEGDRYRVLHRPTLDDAEIFGLLAGEPPDAAAAIRRTLALVPAADGGVDILLGEAGPENRGSAERLLIEEKPLEPAEHVKRDHCPLFSD